MAAAQPSPAAPLLIAAAPNGAFKTRADHPEIPLNPAELASTAAAVLDAGARMLHLHVRDAAGRHTLDAAAYAGAVAAIRARVGGELLIQCTSEAAGVYGAAEQRDAVRAITDLRGVDGVSLAVRELAGTDADAAAAAPLFHRLARRGILAQYIVYAAADIARYADLRARGIIPAGGHALLLVAGKRGGGEIASEKLRRMVAALPAGVPWMACAFGDGEFDCLATAAELGGHVRIGFENTLLLRDGNPAADNRALIAQFAEFTRPSGRPLANLAQARAALSGHSGR